MRGFGASRRHAARNTITGFEAPCSCGNRIRRRLGSPAASAGTRVARLRTEASGPSAAPRPLAVQVEHLRLRCPSTHAAVSYPQNWPLPTRSPKCRTCRPVPPCSGPVPCGRALGRQTVASPQARHLSARRAQNINARVGDTLPEVNAGLKSKTGQHCEHRVEDGECLWMALENV